MTDTNKVDVEPVAWMIWTNGPVLVFMNKDEAKLEFDRLNRLYPIDSGDRKLLELVPASALAAAQAEVEKRVDADEVSKAIAGLVKERDAAQAEAREYQQACDRMAMEHKVERDALRLENEDHIQQLRKEQLAVQRLRETFTSLADTLQRLADDEFNIKNRKDLSCGYSASAHLLREALKGDV